MNREEPAPLEVDDLEMAQQELKAAAGEYGATSMHLCAKGEVSPAALRAVAESIRSLSKGE
ncbi:hypothetical protein [Microbacterium lacticum]